MHYTGVSVRSLFRCCCKSIVPSLAWILACLLLFFVSQGLAVSPWEALTLFGDASLATPPEDVARALALAAYWRSLDKEAQTPFSKEARRCCNTQMMSLHHQSSPEGNGVDAASPAHAMFLAGLLNGGKEDDITVAAAWVCRKDRCLYTPDVPPEKGLTRLDEAPSSGAPVQSQETPAAASLDVPPPSTREKGGQRGDEGQKRETEGAVP